MRLYYNYQALTRDLLSQKLFESILATNIYKRMKVPRLLPSSSHPRVEIKESLCIIGKYLRLFFQIKPVADNNLDFLLTITTYNV